MRSYNNPYAMGDRPRPMSREDLDKQKEEKRLHEQTIAENEARTKYENSREKKALDLQNEGRAYDKFIDDVETYFVTESLCYLMEETNRNGDNDTAKTVIRNIVNEYVNKYGSYDIIKKMSETSMLLSEMAYYMKDTIKVVQEKAIKGDPTTLKIDSKEKDKFFDKIKSIDVGKAKDSILSRVTTATNKFLDKNSKDKKKIEDVLLKAKEKITNSKDTMMSNDALKEEAYIIESCNIAISKIRDTSSRRCSVLEEMVTTLSMSIKDNEDSVRVFIENGTLSIDKVVLVAETAFNVLMSMDLLMLENVDDKYIEDFVKSLAS